MSFVKRQLERQMEEGWSSVGTDVCPDCFTDYAIKAFINANLTANECDYCGRKADTPIAADTDEVLSFLSNGLWREYDIPENCLPYDSSEGGWQLVTPSDSHDVFADLDVCSEDSGELFDDLAGAFSDRSFVQRDPMVLSEADGLKYSWSSFCDHTKHQTRFVFFKVRAPRRPKNHSWHPDDEWGGYSPPYQILLNLGAMVKKHGLIRVLPGGTSIVRARQHSAGDTYSTAKDLGAPPKEKASQSRMSPAGIAMFYGGADENTAFLETFDSAATTKGVVTFGTFATTRKLNVLDLTQLPQIPSIFDENNYGARAALIFLHHFKRDISQPIARDGREHYEYVPTQIVAEYFRRVFKHGGRPVGGLAFNSSRAGADVCYCIFGDATNCTDGPNVERGHMLVLTGHRTAAIDFTSASFA